ncbi:DDE family transposase [Micromonospora sp. Llam0]|nr:DDE family transposase [Micromonospora sp. Llam0]
MLKSVARQRLAAGQGELDLGLDDSPDAGGPLEITSSRMGHLWDALCRGYDQLGFAEAAGGDEVFRQLVLARIIEPTSKQDSLRVLDEVGVDAVSYPTVNRRLPQYAKAGWRQRLSAACAAHARLGPASLVLYDVSTLYFETDAGDGFRESGFSKQRRLEPQITIGLLTDAGGFPLMVEAFEGNKAETLTMVPTIRSFMDAHRLPDVTVVADAGMISAANQRAIEDAGLSFILGARIADVPYAVAEWRREHPRFRWCSTDVSRKSRMPPDVLASIIAAFTSSVATSTCPAASSFRFSPDPLPGSTSMARPSSRNQPCARATSSGASRPWNPAPVNTVTFCTAAGPGAGNRPQAEAATPAATTAPPASSRRRVIVRTIKTSLT